MKSVFESANKIFDDERIDSFKYAPNDEKLFKELRKYLSSGSGKVPFVWQMSGNRIDTTIKNFIKNEYSDVVSLITIPANEVSVRSILSSPVHIYDDAELAIEDDSEGVILVEALTKCTDTQLIKFLVDLAAGTSTYKLAAGWKLIFTGNIDNGDAIWDPSFKRIFTNIEWESSSDYASVYDGENEDEDLDEGFENQENLDSENEMDIEVLIKGIIEKNLLNGDLTEDEYLYFDKGGVLCGTIDELSDKEPIFSAADIIDWNKFYEDGEIEFDDFTFDDILDAVKQS